MGGYKRTAPDIYLDYILAKEFGWTLKQVDELDNYDREILIHIINTENKRANIEIKKQNGQRKITTNNFR